MADISNELSNSSRKLSRRPLLLGVCLACIGGGGAFYAIWSESVFPSNPGVVDTSAIKESIADVAYVEIPPLTISLRAPSNSKFLRFRASLEVFPNETDSVSQVLPRIIDVLNSYLRAIEPADFEDSAALVRIRSQMVRRIQVIVGPGKVRDLLILEFVLN